MIFESLIDRMMTHYTSGRYLSEVREAKEEFFEKAGAFDEGTVDFELKMAQFVDWYLFMRKMKITERVPIEMVLDDPAYEISDEERPAYLNLRNSRHSLFEFQKVKKDDVYIKDLFTNFKYVLEKSRITQGFNRDEYFESRLIPTEGGGFSFSPAFCFHPAVVSKFILKEVKRINKLPEEQQAQVREEFTARLFKMKHKHEQYRHLDVHQIYSNESKLKI